MCLRRKDGGPNPGICFASLCIMFSMPVRLLLIAAVLCLASTALAENPFLAVMVDARTEQALGPFPYDRRVLAQAVRRASQLGAKGVILKFFLPEPRSEKGDLELATAMKDIKVILQAGYPENPPGRNRLPDRFRLSLSIDGKPLAMHATPGGIPLPIFSNAAYDIGWVDAPPAMDRAPVIEWYDGRYV